VATLPTWVIYSCYFAIAWGTYLGGWRIVKTMGTKITKLNAVSGSCASMGGAITLGLATLGGIPVSTTHTITGAIIGVGAATDVKAVRWAITMNLLVAWVLTIPGCGPDRGNLLVHRDQVPVAQRRVLAWNGRPGNGASQNNR
jgi:PiT family inorganic phosphate transporter